MTEKLQRSADDALAIWEGACNPRAVARSLTDAIAAAMDAGATIDNRQSPLWLPAKMIGAQLAYLIGAKWNGLGEWGSKTDEDEQVIRQMADGTWEG